MFPVADANGNGNLVNGNNDNNGTAMAMAGNCLLGCFSVVGSKHTMVPLTMMIVADIILFGDGWEC